MPAPKEKMQPKTSSAAPPPSEGVSKVNKEPVRQPQTAVQPQVTPQYSSSSPAPASTETLSRPRTPSREEIELAAYALYLERGGLDGYAVDDWLQAERELMEGTEAQRKVRAKSA